jgi:hypothetical protein
MNRKAAMLLALTVALLVPVLAGCSDKAAPLTPKEEANFKGGPMPPEAREIMQQRMREAQEKAARERGGSAAPGAPAAPPAPGG